jgi:hypothetical protein
VIQGREELCRWLKRGVAACETVCLFKIRLVLRVNRIT